MRCKLCPSGSMTLVFLLLSGFSTETLAQQTVVPEHQRLSSFVGEWTYEDSYETGTMTCDWLGKAFVLCHQLFTEPSGVKVPVLQVFGYDSEEEVYTINSFYSHNGLSWSGRGWVEGTTWTWVWGDNPGGLMRLIGVDETPDSRSLKWEFAPRGGPWEVTMEATLTRVR